MAYIVGYVSAADRKELERRGWEIEDAKDYDLQGELGSHLLCPEGTHNDVQAVVIFVEASVFEIMNGPDWDKG